MSEDLIRSEEIAEPLQVEVMEDYIRDASQLDEGIIKNEYLREHFTKLIDWIIAREDKIKEKCKEVVLQNSYEEFKGYDSFLRGNTDRIIMEINKVK